MGAHRPGGLEGDHERGGVIRPCRRPLQCVFFSHRIGFYISAWLCSRGGVMRPCGRPLARRNAILLIALALYTCMALFSRHCPPLPEASGSSLSPEPLGRFFLVSAA